jgi:hypothetical protein
LPESGLTGAIRIVREAEHGPDRKGDAWRARLLRLWGASIKHCLLARDCLYEGRYSFLALTSGRRLGVQCAKDVLPLICDAQILAGVLKLLDLFSRYDLVAGRRHQEDLWLRSSRVRGDRVERRNAVPVIPEEWMQITVRQPLLWIQCEKHALDASEWRLHDQATRMRLSNVRKTLCGSCTCNSRINALAPENEICVWWKGHSDPL